MSDTFMVGEEDQLRSQFGNDIRTALGGAQDAQQGSNSSSANGQPQDPESFFGRGGGTKRVTNHRFDPTLFDLPENWEEWEGWKREKTNPSLKRLIKKQTEEAIAYYLDLNVADPLLKHIYQANISENFHYNTFLTKSGQEIQIAVDVKDNLNEVRFRHDHVDINDAALLVKIMKAKGVTIDPATFADTVEFGEGSTKRFKKNMREALRQYFAQPQTDIRITLADRPMAEPSGLEGEIILPRDLVVRNNEPKREYAHELNQVLSRWESYHLGEMAAKTQKYDGNKSDMELFQQVQQKLRNINAINTEVSRGLCAEHLCAKVMQDVVGPQGENPWARGAVEPNWQKAADILGIDLRPGNGPANAQGYNNFPKPGYPGGLSTPRLN